MAAIFYPTRISLNVSGQPSTAIRPSSAGVCPDSFKPFIATVAGRFPRKSLSCLTLNPHLNFAYFGHHRCIGRRCIRASSSDLGDPEKWKRWEGEEITGPAYEGAAEPAGIYQGDNQGQSQSVVGEQVEAASLSNESVQQCATDQLGSFEVTELGGGGGDIKSGGGQGSGGNGGEGKGGDGGEGEGEQDEKKKKMSASQKLTLAYAALVGVGGLIGYVKSKSAKSLISGAVSSLVLYYVSTQLPMNPVYASSLGLGVSALLLAVMGTRFKKSGKFFPAGIVSVVSLIMTGGYIHGIVRSSHA